MENVEKHGLLRDVVTKTIQDYFVNLDGAQAKNLHSLVIKEVELGLFTTVLKHAKGNQSQAAKWLGLARNTLRKRLKEYNLE